MRILLGLSGLYCIVLGIVLCFLPEVHVVGAIVGVPLLIIGILIAVILARRREL